MSDETTTSGPEASGGPGTTTSGTTAQSRWARQLFGRPLTVERAWLHLVLAQVVVVCILYGMLVGGSGLWPVVGIVGSVLIEVSNVGSLVLAYRHRK